MEQDLEDNLVKITDICRACLTKTDNMKYLLENNEDTLELISKFASVSNMEIELGFKYPSYLCSLCEGKILSSYEFQQQCQKSNDLVYEYLAAFAKQDTSVIESDSNNIPVNSNVSKDNELQYKTQTPDTKIVQITNSISSLSSCEINGENTKECVQLIQEVLENLSQDLKEKYLSQNDCGFCDFHTVNRTLLSDHFFTVHRNLKDAWCPICNKVFLDLKYHTESSHKSDLTCRFCQLQFSSLDSIIKHLQNHQVSRENFEEPKKSVESDCRQNNKYSRSKRKSNNLTDDLKEEMVEEHEECNLEDNNESIDESMATKFKNFSPKQVPVKKGALQRMRLKQYSPEDVDKAIRMVRERMYRHITCIFCSFTAISNRSLAVHVARVHREYKGKWCTYCNKVIENQAIHNKKVHLDDLKCPFCKQVKGNMGHFMEHLASHSAERFHKCEVCDKSFISMRHLRIHRKTHAKEKRFECEFCQKLFLEYKNLKLHLKEHQSCDNNIKIEQSDFVQNKNIEDQVVNNGETDYLTAESKPKDETGQAFSKPYNYCKECNKKVRSLPEHYSKQHIPKPKIMEKQNLCPHCGKQFNTRSKLTVHIRTHTGETPYKCRYCDKRVKSRNILVTHERTHTGEKPYMCTVCGKSFAQSSVLNTHTRIHTGRPEQCTICEKRFCRPAELKLHMRKHTGEKPYVCHHCNQGFKQKSHLSEHVKTHTDDRPYKCEYCEKTFKSNGTLKCHRQIHTGQKPFKCSQCSYACRQPYSLTQHMIQHEHDRPQPDHPHKCQLCQRNYQTLAHLAAHQNRFHPNHSLNTTENPELLQMSNAVNTSEYQLVPEDQDQNYDNNDQVSQENQFGESDQYQVVDSDGNIEPMIVKTEDDRGEMKYERMIQFTTL